MTQSMLNFHFPITSVSFYAFAILLFASATMVIFSKNPVQSALYLVLAFFASSALWIMMHAEFLGLILILVYVGAVMTLFLFVVMTVPFKTTNFTRRHWMYAALAGFVVILFMGVMLKITVPFSHLSYQLKQTPLPGISGAEAIGMVLYTQYIFPFELAGLILLIAIIAAISLSWKTNRQKQIVNASKQISVTAKSRLKIIKDNEGNA